MASTSSPGMEVEAHKSSSTSRVENSTEKLVECSIIIP